MVLFIWTHFLFIVKICKEEEIIICSQWFCKLIYHFPLLMNILLWFVSTILKRIQQKWISLSLFFRKSDYFMFLFQMDPALQNLIYLDNSFDTLERFIFFDFTLQKCVWFSTLLRVFNIYWTKRFYCSVVNQRQNTGVR